MIESLPSGACCHLRTRAPGFSLNQSSAVRLRHLAAVLVFAWLTYLVAASQPSFSPDAYTPVLVQQGLVAALAIAYLVYLVLGHRPGATRLDLPLFALVVVYFAANLDSVDRRVSLEASLTVLAAVVTFYAFHDFRFLTTDLLVRGLAAMGAVLGLLALYHVGAEYLRWLDLVRAVDGAGSDLLPPTIPRVQGVGGHVNVLAMALNLALPFLLILVLQPRWRFERALAAAGLVVVLAALFFTVSRGAWLGTIAATPVFFGLYALRHRDLAGLGAFVRGRARHLLPLALAGGLVLLLVIVLVASRWQSRPDWLFRSSLSPRQDAVATGLDIFRDRPWLGAGPSTYSLLYDVYSGEYPIQNIHPHNGYVNVLVDTGLAGALVLAGGGLVLVFGLGGAYRGGDASQRTLVAATAAALTTLAVHSLLDSPNAWLTSLLPLAVVLALAMRIAGPGEIPLPLALAFGDRWAALPKNLGVLKLRRLGFMPILPVLLLIGFITVDLGRGAYHDSLGALNDGDFPRAAARATDAARTDNALAAYHIHAGVMSADAYVVARDAGRTPDPALLDEAITHLERGVVLDPRSAIGLANLALVHRLREDRAAATEAAERALTVAGGDGTIAAVAGTVFEWADEREAALAAYARALSHDAGLVQSPFWATSPFREAARHDALAASTLTDCEKGRVSVLYRGFDDDLAAFEAGCRARVEDAPADARARSDLAVILYGLGRRDEARREAEDAVRRVPDSPFARTAYAITIAPDRDVGRVRHELMLAAYLGDPDAALLLAYTYAPPPGSPVLRNTGLPTEPGPLPAPVVHRLKAAVPIAAPFVYDNGVQRYLLGVLYYRVSFQRESPTTILIPGDWLTFTSPRALLIVDALRGK